MHFDTSVNLGNVLTAAILLVGFIRAHIQNLERLTKIETKLDMIYRWWCSHVRPAITHNEPGDHF